MMNANINEHIFRQTTVDSGALTQLGAVVQEFPKNGHYEGAVIFEDEMIGRFYISVDKSSPVTQVTVDLATVGRWGQDSRVENFGRQQFVVGPGGVAVFYVSEGAGGFAVTLTRLRRKEKEREVVLDSRELKQGTVFAVTLIRPGKYKLLNLTSGATGRIEVAYPKVDGRPQRPLAPIEIACTDRKFTPSSIQIAAAQGQAFHIETRRPARIKIELVEADDGDG